MLHKIETIPNNSWKKEDIQQLQAKFADHMIKIKLLYIIKQ